MTMREHLFRAKRIYNNEWAYGNLVVDKNGEPHIVEFESAEEDGHHVVIDGDTPMFVIPETVGEYTGLTDKNGKKIFEGDIVECVSLANDHHQKGARVVSPVCFWEGAYCLEVTLVALTTDFRVCHTFEVIGTIFDEVN